MPPKKPAPSGAAAEPAEVEADAEPVQEMGMTLEKVKQFYKMKDRNQYKAFFEGVFEKSGTELSARETIVIDYHVFSMTFCFESGFTAEQTVDVFKALELLLEKIRLTPALGADEYLSSLKESLLASAKKRNTAGSQLLSLADVKRVVDYAMRFIFKQLPLYQYVFTVDQDSTEKTHKVFVETPMPWTLDLGAAFPTAEEAQKAAESASVEAQGSEVKEEEVDKEPSAAASAASGSEVPEAAVESQEKKEEQMIDTGDGNKVDRSKLEQDIQKAVRSGIELAKKELKSGSK